MPREPKRDIPPLSLTPPESFTVHLKTITPMFGGSAQTRQVDEQHPVRAASVRGHLRFWWRATAGAGYSTSEKLYEAESELWGSTEKAGKVRVEVVSDNRQQQRIYPSDLNKGGGSPAQTGPREAYFVHPFQASKEATEAFGLMGVQFELKVTLDAALTQEKQAEVERSIRAWIAFGGIGSRTRRGCGALTVTQDTKRWLPKAPETLWEWFADEPESGRAEHSLLNGARVYLGKTDNREDVTKGIWRDLGRFWARFRKGHFTERRPEYSPMSGGAWSDHQTLKRGIEKGEGAKLSKPFLGLPIIYQKFPKTQAFSGTLEAVGAKKSRMASPVILKPCAFQDGLRGLVLVLNTPHPTGISFSGQEFNLSIPEYDPVLLALKVRGPLAAVGTAAKLSGYSNEVTL